jgi:ribosomal protein L16 Arg81 hydroxylase
MNRFGFKTPTVLKNALKKFVPVAHCDEVAGGSLVEDADAALVEKKPKIKTPVQYLDIHDVLQKGNVHTFDGFRVQVQKQLNLNVVVSHL